MTRFAAILCFLVPTGVAFAQTIPEEIARLASDDGATRMAAARKLRDLARQDARKEGKEFRGQTAGICAALRRDGEEVRILCVLLEVLERVGEPACADVLPALLRHADAKVRAGVAPVLVRALDAKGAGQQLVALLGDREARVRARAARALGTLRGFAAKEPLLGALRDADDDVRKAAAGALVALNEPGTITALVEALADPKSPARTVVRLALAELTGRDFGDDAAAWRTGLLSDSSPPRPPTGTAPSPAFEKLAQQIRIQFESARADERSAGLKQVGLAIQRYGKAKTLDALLPAFERLLKDADPAVRRETLALLQGFRDGRLMDPLLRVLQEDPPMRAQALMALPESADRRVREVLVGLLADESPTTVEMALERLQKQADASLIPAVIAAARNAKGLGVINAATRLLTAIGRDAVVPLIEACGRENAMVRRIAIGALGNLGDERALDLLLAALEDKDFFVKKNACEALKRLEGNGLQAAILARLEHGNPQVRSRAMEILGARGSMAAPDASGPAGALDALIKGLQDSKREVQISAAKGLGELRDPRAAEPLIRAIGEPKFSAKAEAAKALACLLDGATVELVVKAIPQASADDRQYLIGALRETGPPAQNALMAMLDGSAAWKFEVALALSYQIDPAHRGRREPVVVERLLKYAAEDRTFTTADENERIWFLQRLADPRAVRLMLETTRASQGKVPQTLTIVLGKPDAMVAEALVAALRDQDTALRRAAAYILGYAKPRTAVDALLAAFDDPDQTVRTWAVWALGQSLEGVKSPADARTLAQRLVRVLEKRTEAVEVRFRAAEALRRIRDDAHLPALVAVLTDAREPTALRVQCARTLQGTSYGPAKEALQQVKSRSSEPQELREACMTLKEAFEHAKKR